MKHTDEQESAPDGSGAYRRLLTSARWRRFTVAIGFQRVSIAMAPVALVLAGHAALGSFRAGALMASTYTFAYGIVSPWSGRLIDRIELRRGITVELAAATVILLALAGLTASRAPTLVLIVLSGLAGAAPAGVLGGLRAYLQRIVSEDLRERAFALDATLLELEWMTAPTLVAVTGFLGVPVLAIVLMAIASLGALGGTRLLSRQQPTPRIAGVSGAWRNPKALPVYVLNAILEYAEGTINIALAPLMLTVGARPAAAGFLITLVSLTSAAGAVGYAMLLSRRSGNTNQYANIALVALGLCVALIAVAPSLVLLALAVAACGIWIAPSLIMRNLILGKVLPESQLSEGFSTFSAAGALGYGVSGVVTGIMLGFTGARACFILAAATTVVSGLAAWCWYHFSPQAAGTPPAEAMPDAG